MTSFIFCPVNYDTHWCREMLIPPFSTAYHIDYNGTYYGPVELRHSINYYEGEKDITTLEIYPMRFVKDSQQVKNRLYDQGKTFQNMIKNKHLHYDGWTLVCATSFSNTFIPRKASGPNTLLNLM